MEPARRSKRSPSGKSDRQPGRASAGYFWRGHDRGLVTVETKGFNQRGEEVCYFRRKVMVWKKDAAPARGRPYPDDAAQVWGELPSE